MLTTLSYSFLPLLTLISSITQLLFQTLLTQLAGFLHCAYSNTTKALMIGPGTSSPLLTSSANLANGEFVVSPGESGKSTIVKQLRLA